jgi:predicted DNA-binding ribbon-helix-helix protein
MDVLNGSKTVTRCSGMRPVGTSTNTGWKRKAPMKSPVVKRSIVIAGHKTSVSLEDAFWKSLKQIAGERHMTLSDLVATIDTGRQHGNLSSGIRLFVLEYFQAQYANRSTEQEPRRNLTVAGARA